MDDERLKELGGGGYFKELLDRIRDIRSSEEYKKYQAKTLSAVENDYLESLKFLEQKTKEK